MASSLGLLKQKLDENYVSFKQLLKTAAYRTAAVWPLTFPLANHQCKTCWLLLNKHVSDILLWTPFHRLTSGLLKRTVQPFTKNYQIEIFVLNSIT